MSFISALAQDLVKRDDVYDLSRISEFFFFGMRETISAIEFVGLIQADDLNELQIVELRNRYLAAVQQASYDFGTRTYGRNPNGLLVFVFERPMSPKLADFIRKQTQASLFRRPAVIFSWAVDTCLKQMHTHNPWVHAFPPIFILESAVFPGKNYIAKFLWVKSSKAANGHNRGEMTKPPAVQSVNLTPEALQQVRAIFEVVVSEVIEDMPSAKYSFPNAREVKIFEQVGQYIETQNASDPEVKEALEDLKQILQELQAQNPQASEEEAMEILDVEVEAIRRREPQRWRQLANLRRWQNGAKKGALKVGEHLADSTVWGKALVGFLEGASDDVE